METQCVNYSNDFPWAHHFTQLKEPGKEAYFFGYHDYIHMYYSIAAHLCGLVDV